ncbi:MAG: hypothetical protein DRJ49_06620 [Thermoprotei archaeon]|nr:MAG: hypothetical protein DRJ49_06620 [Thermoprotei archaeon]
MLLDVKSELPMLRVPISLIVDDWSVCYIDRSGKLESRRTYESLVDLLSLGEIGVRGKLSLVPCIVKSNRERTLLGCIDKGIRGLSKEELLKTLYLVRTKAIEYFDITPEILTHSLTIDLKTGNLLDETEWGWSQRQDLKSLKEYIAQALSILRNVGIIASGVTSPCDFGREVEGIYAQAVLEAEKVVNGITLTWYFLHVEPHRNYITPRLMYFNEENKEAVVSIISCSKDYLGKSRVEAVYGDPYKLADAWITEDGRGGRLVELYRRRSYLVFHTHWWNTHGEDDKVGFNALRETILRINKVLGDNVVWMKCSEIARYFATSKVFKLSKSEVSQSSVKLIFRTPFNCRDFTISFMINGAVKRVKVNGHPLKRGVGRTLEPNSWITIDERTYVCFNLTDGSILEVEI